MQISAELVPIPEYLLGTSRRLRKASESSLHFQIIDPLIPKDMFRLVFLVKPVFFAREGVAF